jgi:hypothetical protein
MKLRELLWSAMLRYPHRELLEAEKRELDKECKEIIQREIIKRKGKQ